MKHWVRHFVLAVYHQTVGIAFGIMAAVVLTLVHNLTWRIEPLILSVCIGAGWSFGFLAFWIRTGPKRRIVRFSTRANVLPPPPNPRDLARQREPQSVEPFEARLTRFTQHAAPERQSTDDDFRSAMPFWSADTWFMKRAPKSAAAIRAILHRIQRYLAN